MKFSSSASRVGLLVLLGCVMMTLMLSISVGGGALASQSRLVMLRESTGDRCQLIFLQDEKWQETNNLAGFQATETKVKETQGGQEVEVVYPPDKFTAKLGTGEWRCNRDLCDDSDTSNTCAVKQDQVGAELKVIHCECRTQRGTRECNLQLEVAGQSVKFVKCQGSCGGGVTCQSDDPKKSPIKSTRVAVTGHPEEKPKTYTVRRVDRCDCPLP